MYPALGVGDLKLPGVLLVGRVAVGEQHAADDRGEPQGATHMLASAGGKEREAHLIEFPVDWPEVAGLHLAVTGAAGLDGRLVHRDHAACSDRAELRLVEGLEQPDRLLGDLRQPRAGYPDGTVLQALMLPVQGRVE